MPDSLELVNTVAALRSAEAISVETAVAQAHLDWDPTQVAAEVKRMYTEMNLDVLSWARVMIGGDPNEDLLQQLREIPQALAGGDNVGEVEQDADATTGGGAKPTIQ